MIFFVKRETDIAPILACVPTQIYPTSCRMGQLCSNLPSGTWVAAKSSKVIGFRSCGGPHHPAVTYVTAQHQGRLFWITCKRLKILRKAGRLQLILNLAPSVTGRRQCCIQMVGGLFYTLPSIPGLTLWFVLILYSSHNILCESDVAKSLIFIKLII